MKVYGMTIPLVPVVGTKNLHYRHADQSWCSRVCCQELEAASLLSQPHRDLLSGRTYEPKYDTRHER